MKLQPGFHCSSLSTLDTGSGREAPAICHGTGVCHRGFTPASSSTGNGQIPGCSFILSVQASATLAAPDGARGRRGAMAVFDFDQTLSQAETGPDVGSWGG